MTVLACSTHALLIDIPLFAGPVLMLTAALLIATIRDRHRRRLGQTTARGPGPLRPGPARGGAG